MSGWIIALIVATILLIATLIWAVARLVAKLSSFLDSITRLASRLQASEIVEKIGAVLKNFADLEEIVKEKLGPNQKKEFEALRTALEELRTALKGGGGDPMHSEAKPLRVARNDESPSI